MSTYKKMHAVVSSDLTDQANIFDRNLVGISLREADKVHVQIGCKTVEDYLIRMSLNEESFTSLVTQSLGHTPKTRNMLTLLKKLVKELSFLHRATFILR